MESFLGLGLHSQYGTMANTYMTNPRLNVILYQDYLRATQDLSRIDRLRLIVKRTRKTLTNKIS